MWQDTETLEFCDPPDAPNERGDLIFSITQRGDFGSPDVTVNTENHNIEIEVLREAMEYALRRFGLPGRP